MPNGDSRGHRYVEGMFRAELRDFEANVGEVDDFGGDAVYFIAGDDGVGLFRVGGEPAQIDAAFYLFEDAYADSFGFESADAVDGGWKILPLDRELGSKGCFVNFGRWRCGGNSAEHNFSDEKCIGCAEYGSDVVEGADVVEDNGDG